MRPLVLSLFGLLAVPALAQPTPGFVVTASGDTLRGEVTLGTEAENARGVRFRPDPDAGETPYGLTEATAFGADAGRRYRRGSFQLRATRDVDPVTPNDRLAFARVVRDGAADLLALETSAGRTTYYVQTGGETAGLYLVQDEVTTGAGRRLRERALYRQTLRTLLGTCATSDAEYAGLPYTEAALAGVVDGYNRCADAEYVARGGSRAVRRQTTVAFEAGGAVAAGSLRRGASAPPAPSSYEAPGTSAFRARVAAEVAPALLPRPVRLVVGVEYDHDVARLYRSAAEAKRLSTVHGVLGVRLAVPAGGLAFHLGTGLLLGPVLDRAVDASTTPPDDVVRYVSLEAVESSTGQYGEVGVRVVGAPVALTVRLQQTAFSGGGPVPVPFTQSSQFGTRTVSVGLDARF